MDKVLTVLVYDGVIIDIVDSADNHFSHVSWTQLLVELGVATSDFVKEQVAIHELTESVPLVVLMDKDKIVDHRCLFPVKFEYKELSITDARVMEIIEEELVQFEKSR